MRAKLKFFRHCNGPHPDFFNGESHRRRYLAFVHVAVTIAAASPMLIVYFTIRVSHDPLILAAMILPFIAALYAIVTSDLAESARAVHVSEAVEELATVRFENNPRLHEVRREIAFICQRQDYMLTKGQLRRLKGFVGGLEEAFKERVARDVMRDALGRFLND